MRPALALALVVLGVLGVASHGRAARVPAGVSARHSHAFTVRRVIDGDTIKLANGRSVRLLQIDSPELQEGECYGAQAKQALSRLLRPGSLVRLQTDPKLDTVDRYGRLLRYVIRRGTNLNVQLVRVGAASVWFYDGVRGRYAGRLLAAAAAARKAGRGLWGACPGTVFDPTHGVNTGLATGSAAASGCDPSYPTVCIPPPPPDLDCGDISYTNFTVLPPDPHHFDGNHNGVGCEG